MGHATSGPLSLVVPVYNEEARLGAAEVVAFTRRLSEAGAATVVDTATPAHRSHAAHLPWAGMGLSHSGQTSHRLMRRAETTRATRADLTA